MTHSPRRSGFARAALAGAAALALAAPTRAQIVVHDPGVYAQSVLTASRALQQVNNEIQTLQNQARMLVNQARNLASLPYSSAAPLLAAIDRTGQLLKNAQRIGYDATAIDQAFARAYPSALTSTAPNPQLAAGAQERWRNALAGFQDAMLAQAGAVQNLEGARAQVSALMSASQSAVGALQAAQAGNQLAALQAQQLADLTAVMAAIARAQSLEGARRAEDEAMARQQTLNFLKGGQGYRAQPVTLFP